MRNLSTGHDEVVYRAFSGGANDADVTRPTYDAETNAFVWARTNIGSGAGNRIVRYTLPGSKLTYAQGSPRYNTTAWAGRSSAPRPRRRWTAATASTRATTPASTSATSP